MDVRVDGKTVFVRMHKGEKFFEALEKACEKAGIQTAAVVSAVGMLSEFELGYFKKKGNYTKQFFEKPHELVTMNGLILKEENGYDFHLHAVFGDEDKSLKGGHFFSGKVKVTAELVLLKSGAGIKRELEKETGLMGLKVK